MLQRKIKRYNGRRLSNEQVAIASLLAQAIGNYSEDTFCAGWSCGIEHELWERIVARPPDAYERAVKKLYAAAKKDRRDWGKPTDEFLAGLKLLAQRFQVWILYKNGETAVHLKDWLPLHEQWRENEKRQRPALEEVWERIHRPFLKPKKIVRIPPMPKLNGVSLNHSLKRTRSESSVGARSL